MDAQMAATLKLVAANNVTHSDYDWMNVYIGDQFVGKLRGKVCGKTITIYTITIFPEFQTHGYGKLVIEQMQEDFETIIADRVRFTAVGFWEKMGFATRADGCFEYHR